MICPKGHSAELETKLVDKEPSRVEIRCDCAECGKSYFTTLYGSKIQTVEHEDPPQPAVGKEVIDEKTE